MNSPQNEIDKFLDFDVFVVITIFVNKDMDVQVFKSLTQAHEYQETVTDEHDSYSVVYPKKFQDV